MLTRDYVKHYFTPEEYGAFDEARQKRFMSIIQAVNMERIQLIAADLTEAADNKALLQLEFNTPPFITPRMNKVISSLSVGQRRNFLTAMHLVINLISRQTWILKDTNKTSPVKSKRKRKEKGDMRPCLEAIIDHIAAVEFMEENNKKLPEGITELLPCENIQCIQAGAAGDKDALFKALCKQYI